MSRSFTSDLSRMKGKLVRITTPTVVYRGICENIDPATLSFLLRDVESLVAFGRAEEEEWKRVSELMLIRGDYTETACLEPIKKKDAQSR